MGGLIETVETLERAGIEFAGAGRTRYEATRPAILKLGNVDSIEDGWDVKCWSFSKHPRDWAKVDGFNLTRYTAQGRNMMKERICTEELDANSTRGHQQKLGLNVVSMHWGPNYQWHPSRDIIFLAHWLIDECDIDLAHGHSSHHIQGVGIYKRKLIIYGR